MNGRRSDDDYPGDELNRKLKTCRSSGWPDGRRMGSARGAASRFP